MLSRMTEHCSCPGAALMSRLDKVSETTCSPSKPSLLCRDSQRHLRPSADRLHHPHSSQLTSTPRKPVSQRPCSYQVKPAWALYDMHPGCCGAASSGCDYVPLILTLQEQAASSKACHALSSLSATH